ncbi:MAG: bifunctional DNA primase/polymerase [Acidobacteria bacterium]|nr:bifunctional DNA primase/polymerase [Acidobacteriota bacterium]
MNKMEAARRYAEIDWPVFPVHTPTGDLAKPCSCGRVACPRIGKHPCHKNTCKDKGKHPCHQSVCDSVGKHPRTKNGVKDATLDEGRIREWWDMWKDANVGVATGKEAGFFVLDVDPRSGGHKALADLEREHGKLPETRSALTGGDGVHYFFKYPDFTVRNSAGKLGLGLDIKSDGGSIVVAPSLHASGRRYRWRNGAPIAEAPAWLLRLLRASTHKSYASGNAEIGGIIPEGRRNDMLTSLAGTMRRRGMVAEEIAPALLAVNSKRCSPPLAEDEVRKIAAGVCRYAPADEATCQSYCDCAKTVENSGKVRFDGRTNGHVRLRL